jgi:hypothetical protein
MAGKRSGKRQLLTSAAVGVGLVGIPAQAAVWTEGDRVYMREAGTTTEVTATPELLAALRAVGGKAKLPSDPKLIMSGGGGAAFSLDPFDLVGKVRDALIGQKEKKGRPQTVPTKDPPTNEEHK